MATTRQLSSAHTQLLIAQLAATAAFQDLGYERDEAAGAIRSAIDQIQEAFLSVSTRLHAELNPKMTDKDGA